MAKDSFKHHLISLLYSLGLVVCTLMASFTIAMLIRKETASAIFGIVITVLVAVPIRKIPKHIKESNHKVVWAVYGSILLLLSVLFAFTGNNEPSVSTNEQSSVTVSKDNISETEIVPERAFPETEPKEEAGSSEAETTVTTSQPTTTKATTISTTTKQTTTTTKQTTTAEATTTTKLTTTTAETTTTTIPTTTTTQTTTQIKMLHFIVNYDTSCIHIDPDCPAAQKILLENYGEIDIPENELGNYKGIYWACGRCSKLYNGVLEKF